MSRGRDLDWLYLRFPDGTLAARAQRVQRPVSLGAIPRRDRAVEVLDPAGHLIAVVTRTGNSRRRGSLPLLWREGQDLTPAAAVTDDGIDGIMVVDGQATLLGARPEWRIACHRCALDWPVTAADLAVLETRRPRVHRLIDRTPLR